MDHSNDSLRYGRQLVAELEDGLRQRRDSDRLQVLGHRGSPAPGHLENSVAAVSDALRQGADGVEIDVRLTADGVLVCAHDPFVSTPTGARLDVAASTSADLIRGGRACVATLAEVLAAAQRPAGSRVVVEAKPVAGAAASQRTADALAQVLRTAAGDGDITVSSFDAALLAMIRTRCADLPVRTALLGESSAPAAATMWRAHEDGHDEVHLPLDGVRRMPGVVEAARRLGLSITLWTVNSRRDLCWAAELGVDAVITDDVPGARRELARCAVEDPTALVVAA